MNANDDPLKTTFTPENVFQEHPSRALSRAAEDSELEKLKVRLLRQTLNELASTDADGFIRRAAREAAALAWTTHFPLLVFPTLFEEKTRAALAQMRRQLSVRLRSLELLQPRGQEFQRYAPLQLDRTNLYSVAALLRKPENHPGIRIWFVDQTISDS